MRGVMPTKHTRTTNIVDHCCPLLGAHEEAQKEPARLRSQPEAHAAACIPKRHVMGWMGLFIIGIVMRLALVALCCPY